MANTIAEIHQFHSKCLCQWCGGSSKKECVTVTFNAGLLQQAVVCIKCLRNALRVNSLQGETPKPAS
jgi:hypothetical protein